MPTNEEQQWLEAWRRAAPELERIRNEELRRLDEAAGLRLLGGSGRQSETETSGLAIFQAWMMRLRVLQMMHSNDSQ